MLDIAADDGMDVFVFGIGFYGIPSQAQGIVAVDVGGYKAKTTIAAMVNPHHRMLIVGTPLVQN